MISNESLYCIDQSVNSIAYMDNILKSIFHYVPLFISIWATGS